MHFFEGLQSYECVLLVLGALTFLALVSLLIVMVIKRIPYGKLFPFFVVPVVMMGFPGIEKIKFDKGIVEIEKLTKEVEQGPTNVQAKQELEVKLRAMEGREVSSPSTLRTLEKAYTAVGDPQRARIYRDRLPPMQRRDVVPK